MKLITLILALFLCGCMQPYVTSMHGESFSLAFDSLGTSEERLQAAADKICQEKFGKKAIQTNSVRRMDGGHASFDCVYSE